MDFEDKDHTPLYIELLKDFARNYDCECVVGTRTTGNVLCRSCMSLAALQGEDPYSNKAQFISKDYDWS